MENHGHGQDGLFDFERLVVYQKAMAFLELVSGLINNPPRKAASVIDHLDRAACSTILNIAEGSGKEQDSADRKHFYRTALASAKESAASLAVLRARGVISRQMESKGREPLFEVVAMLTSMSRQGQ